MATVADVFAKVHCDGTNYQYGLYISKYEEFCDLHGYQAYPPEFETIREFLFPKLITSCYPFVNSFIAAVQHEMHIRNIPVTVQFRKFGTGLRRLATDKSVKDPEDCNLTIEDINIALRLLWLQDHTLEVLRTLVMIVISVHSNLRIGDMVNLTTKHIQFTDETCSIITGIRKNDQYNLHSEKFTFPRVDSWCHVAILRVAMYKLGVTSSSYLFYNTQKPHQALDAKTLHGAMKKAMSLIPVERFTVQDIRKAVLKRLIESGADPALCAQIRGWRDASTLQFYSSLSKLKRCDYARMFM